MGTWLIVGGKSRHVWSKVRSSFLKVLCLFLTLNIVQSLLPLTPTCMRVFVILFDPSIVVFGPTRKTESRSLWNLLSSGGSSQENKLLQVPLALVKRKIQGLSQMEPLAR